MTINIGIYTKTNWSNPFPLFESTASSRGITVKENRFDGMDIIYFDSVSEKDFQYVSDQLEVFLKKTPIYVYFRTGTFDPDHYSYREGTVRKHRAFELYINEIASGILAPNEDAVGYMRASGWTSPIYNISGSPFRKDSVESFISSPPLFEDRDMVVTYSNSLTVENQPHYFFDLVEEYSKVYPSVKFKVISQYILHSDVDGAVSRAEKLKKKGLLEIYDALDKSSYYNHIAQSRVLFNCSLTSVSDEGMNEADFLGCNLLFPAVRGFPEAFAHDPNRLYIPWSEDDPFNKLNLLLNEKHHNTGLVAEWNSKTIDRIFDVFLNTGSYVADRNDSKYRRHQNHAKYQVVKIEE